MTKNYFSLIKQEKTVDIDIYGNISSWPWKELGEVSAYSLTKQINELDDVEQINVHISSYGGDVKEGIAIYSALRAHKAKVVTTCDSMACSIASVVFMAGDERIMSHAGMLMIHNAWTYASGNAEELRKQAEDIDKINGMSIEAYMSRVNITEKELKNLMDCETWLTAQESLDMGFATKIETFDDEKNPSQNVERAVMEAISKAFPHALDVLQKCDPDDDEKGKCNPDDVDDDVDDEVDDDENDENDESNMKKQQALRMTERFLYAIKK